MGYKLRYKDELSPAMADEMENIIAQIEAFMGVEHNEDGTHSFGIPTNGQSGESRGVYPQIDFNSQNFLTTVSPGFIQMAQVVLNSGLVNDSLQTVINQLIQNGSIVTSITAIKSVTIAEAALETLNSVPVELVAAPGAGKRIVPLMFTAKVVCSDAYTNAPTLQYVYQGSTTPIASMNPAFSGTNTGRRLGSQPVAVTFDHATFDVTNKAVMVRLSSELTGVGAGQVTCNVAYVIDEWSE